MVWIKTKNVSRGTLFLNAYQVLKDSSLEVLYLSRGRACFTLWKTLRSVSRGTRVF